MPGDNFSRDSGLLGSGSAPAVLLADRDGCCLHVSRRWTELSGLTARECAANGGWLAAVHPDDRALLKVAWSALVNGGKDLSARVRVHPGRTEASPRTAFLQGTALSDGAGFLITWEEVTEQPKNEAELLHARKMEAVGRLASGLAHDFANLLTLISGYSEIVLSRMKANDSQRTEVDEIRKAANRGSALTRQLLTFSRRHAVDPQILDLNTLVTDMQNMLRRMIGEHIDLTTGLNANLGSVKADPGQIEQVIMNLAINARDAMPKGGKISIRTANVELDAGNERVKNGLEAGPYVMLQFADTGQGMDAETLQHLFEPFFTTKDKGKGTGLGLATVYGVVKQGRGDVWAQSEPGRGTTFTIYLPRVEGKSEPALQEAAARAAGLGTETILLVEDEDGVRRLLKHVLGKRGYTVLEAANGPEALSIFQNERRPIDLLLTDIVMPRMSGRELAERLVQLQPALKIIFMSGYTDEVLAGAGGMHPKAAFVQKPLRPDVLAGRVREVLDGSIDGARTAPPLTSHREG